MTIREIQSLVKERYFEADNRRGVFHTFLWFIEEVGELSSAIADVNKANTEEELADVLMWLLTIANLLDIDMETCINKYIANKRKDNPKK